LTGRREVRVSEDYFRQLDSQLGPTTGLHGEPSSTDYLIIELPAVVERFATDFDSLAEFVSGVRFAWMLVTTVCSCARRSSTAWRLQTAASS
jgi:hypothetical protein